MFHFLQEESTLQSQRDQFPTEEPHLAKPKLRNTPTGRIIPFTSAKHYPFIPKCFLQMVERIDAFLASGFRCNSTFIK